MKMPPALTFSCPEAAAVSAAATVMRNASDWQSLWDADRFRALPLSILLAIPALRVVAPEVWARDQESEQSEPAAESAAA